MATHYIYSVAVTTLLNLGLLQIGYRLQPISLAWHKV